MRIRALLFKIQNVVDVVNVRNNVDICGTDFCRPVLKSHENAKISAVRSLADICFLHVLIRLIRCIIVSVCSSVFKWC